MTDTAQALAVLGTEDRHFLAGVLFARGKVYLGRSARGKSFRYSPMLTVELSQPLTPAFAELFDGPYVRRYYGNEVLRYTLQDIERIAKVLSAIIEFVPDAWSGRLITMLDFCQATTAEQRDRAYQALAA